MSEETFDNEQLGEETMEAIEESLEDLKRGRVYTLKELAEELNLNDPEK